MTMTACGRAERPNGEGPAPQLEELDRGLAAASTSEGIFLSWRLLGHEATGYSERGMTGCDFHVYRNGQLLAKVTDSTNYLDRGGSRESVYEVRVVADGRETERSAKVRPWASDYCELPLRKPADGVTPKGESYTYSANDMSVGDVDGDGRYEFFVKWDPSNSKDVSHSGYTGPVYLECYRLDGTLLYRVDLGVNIRAGAHYTQYLVYDFDGDGRAELMLKTAPGTKTVRYDGAGRPVSETYITMLPEDEAAGYRHSDDYRMSGADYYEHVVRMFMAWHAHEEVVAGRWLASLEQCFGIDRRYRYPLSREDAVKLADYFFDVYAPSRSDRNKLREIEGFILEGPEYLTVFDGETGAELETIRYKPGRHDDGLMWGDYAWNRIEPGNRVDRFLAGVAYLDGAKPYAIFARGYYTRAAVVAYAWDGRRLREVWTADSGWVEMDNPFADTLRRRDGRSETHGSLARQGAHSLSVADVDGDGCQEIVYGAATIDHDGRMLYSSAGVLPAESAAPGTEAKLGHGDALHVANIDPDRPGLEIFMVHEAGVWGPYGYTLRDAATGEVLFGAFCPKDVGRGMVGQVDPRHRGLQVWSSEDIFSRNTFGLLTARGEQIDKRAPGTNMSIRWAADMTTQIVSGSFEEPVAIDDWRRGRLLLAEGTRSNNGTKGNPCLVADIFGDWREELLVRTADSSAIRIYLSTELTDRKLYTLMHDAQYRAGVAWQNVVYNQPCYPSFYFASDIDWSKVPLPERNKTERSNRNMAKIAFDEERIRDAIDRVVDRTYRMDFGWDWPGGVAFYGVCEAYAATGKEEYLSGLKAWADENIADGLPKLSVNAVSIGHSLMTLYEATGEEKYVEVVREMAEFLTHRAERFGDGILQHTVNSETYNFPEQAWADTMFMAGYFLLRAGTLLKRDDYFEDGLKQYHGHEEVLQDAVTNLYYHGWDNLSRSHMSGLYWARGNAWAALTMARALELVPVTHPSFMLIDGSLRDQLSALVRLQDESGLWHTILDDPSSPLETSGSAGIAAALLTRGRLYNKHIQRSIDGILDRIVEDGTVTGVSAGTAVMKDADGYKGVPAKRIQGWGQGLALTFLAAVLNSRKDRFGNGC